MTGAGPAMTGRNLLRSSNYHLSPTNQSEASDWIRHFGGNLLKHVLQSGFQKLIINRK